MMQLLANKKSYVTIITTYTSLVPVPT